MNVGKLGTVTSLDYGECLGKFTFFPNGTSNPTSIVGGLSRFVQSITYSATGVQTIVFTSEFGFAGVPRFWVSAVCDSLANSFEVSQVGQYNATTRTLVIQQRRSQSGYAAAASADCCINILVLAKDTGGR